MVQKGQLNSGLVSSEECANHACICPRTLTHCLGSLAVVLRAQDAYLPPPPTPKSSWAASCRRSRAEECCGRDPGLWPPRLESFVLRSLYGCVRVNGQLQPVSAPCLGSKWEGIGLRGYITLQHPAFPDTTHPEWRSPASHYQGKWHQPKGVTERFLGLLRLSVTRQCLCPSERLSHSAVFEWTFVLLKWV